MLRCSAAKWQQSKYVDGVCILMNLGASSGQISIIAVDTAAGAEVNIQTFGVIVVGMLTLLAFLICSEHLFSMLAFSLCIKLIYMLVGL